MVLSKFEDQHQNVKLSPTDLRWGPPDRPPQSTLSPSTVVCCPLPDGPIVTKRSGFRDVSVGATGVNLECVFLLSDCSAMTTARYRPTWDLALDPLLSCKLCLGEYPAEQMTTIAQCQCIFCTLVGLSAPMHVHGGCWSHFQAHQATLGAELCGSLSVHPDSHRTRGILRAGG